MAAPPRSVTILRVRYVSKQGRAEQPASKAREMAPEPCSLGWSTRVTAPYAPRRLAHGDGAGGAVLLLAGLLARLEAAHLVVDHLLVGLEGAHRRRLAGQPQLLPAAGDAVVDVLAQRRALAGDGQVAVLPAGVDQRLGAVGALLGRVLGRVEPGAPGVAQDVDVLDGIAAAAHRPDHLVHVGRVDVVVDGDDPLRVVGAARHLGGQGEHLRGV